jgi:hypothetical protein
MTKLDRLLSLTSLLAVGCVASTAGPSGSNNSPVPHDLSPPGIQSISAGMAVAYGPVSIPSWGGTVTYQIADQTQTLTSDHFDVAVILDSAIQSWTGPGTAPTFAEKENAVNATATTPLLQTGDYGLVVRCSNFVDNCILSIALTATY